VTLLQQLPSLPSPSLILKFTVKFTFELCTLCLATGNCWAWSSLPTIGSKKVRALGFSDTASPVDNGGSFRLLPGSEDVHLQGHCYHPSWKCESFTLIAATLSKLIKDRFSNMNMFSLVGAPETEWSVRTC
jgi:hypothetical protein